MFELPSPSDMKKELLLNDPRLLAMLWQWRLVTAPPGRVRSPHLATFHQQIDQKVASMLLDAETATTLSTWMEDLLRCVRAPLCEVFALLYELPASPERLVPALIARFNAGDLHHA